MSMKFAQRKTQTWGPKILSSNRPIYLEIVEALRRDIEAGALGPGDPLPSQRELADGIGINFTTVTRAYKEARSIGLISARPGKGTFVALGGTKPATRKPGLIELGSNWPPRVPSHERVWDLVRQIANEEDFANLTYQGQGFTDSHLAAGQMWVSETLGDEANGRLNIAGGTRGALFVALADLVGAGGCLVTESMTWPTLKSLAQLLGIKLHPVKMDGEGLIPSELQTALKKTKAKAVYCVPTAQNPTTATMSQERRDEIAQVAREHSAIILEDDIYGNLVSERASPIAARNPDTTVYISGLAKTLISGSKVAYVVAPNTMIAQRFSERLKLSMLLPSRLEVELATRIILSSTGTSILTELKQEMKVRQEVLASTLGRFTPKSYPGSLHAFVELPSHWSSSTFVNHAMRRGIGVASSDSFAVGDPQTPNALRLSIGATESADELRMALETIGTMLDSDPTLLGDIT